MCIVKKLTILILYKYRRLRTTLLAQLSHQIDAF
jgi:hypothetical protein